MACVYRSIAYQNLGDLDKALADADTAVRLDAKCELAYSSRASVYRAKGEADKATGGLSPR